MALSASFDTPQSGSVSPVAISGTVPAQSQLYAYVTIKVSSTNPSSARSQLYSNVQYFNNTTFTAKAFTATANITVVPKVRTIDTVTISNIDWVVE
ncbi:hypothetical protein [Clostridium ljungdahlii]|uniref:Uncharacterized protein n=1 Tax=Clostridium ljungdahlii TaxID=1538 RepID=A0A166R8C9_9CLOT|nr:hypothetical protein [Clostridium ljungdahlii]OAA90627.1 hypothetical protein WY13_01531 [Clostridium ljungdahlii]